MPRPVPIVLLAALTLGLSACGGNDKQDAEQTVRDFVKATNQRDVNKLCDDLLTTEFIEQTTGATGGKARDACKQQLKTARIQLGLRGIKSTEVKGDKATVTATIELQGRAQDRPFALVKKDGNWRLAGGTGN